MAEIDWTKVPEDMRLHIVQNGTVYIDGQLRLATAADQRASALAGVFTAAGTALIAGLIAFGTASVTPAIHKYPIVAAGITCAAAFLSAGALCIASALPVKMYLPGGQPKTWNNDIRASTSYPDCLKDEAKNIQEKIDENRDIIVANARRYRWGALIGIFGPFIALIVWGFTSLAYLWG